MILLKRSDAVGTMVVTVSEKLTLPTVEYNISFQHTLTKMEVMIPDAQDTSTSPDRYNSFYIDMSLFSEYDNGFYTYKVTDQEGNLLEVGKMKLEGEKTVPVQYQDTPTEYRTYGQ
jgi:hypothetical protein